MNKAVLAVMAFLVGVGVSVGFQNCGGSSLKANNSSGGGLRVEVVNDENSLDGENDPDGEGTDPGDDVVIGEDGVFSVNLGNGDNIFYTTGGGLSLNFSTSRMIQKVHYVLLESHIYEQRGTTFPRDLPDSYCADSALPHCAHRSTDPCVGLGCYKSTTPVRCHWQHRMSTTDINRSIAALNAMRFLNRLVTPDEPMISDCNNPLLYFYKQTGSVQISLANKACVPNGMYYTVDDSGDNIEGIFNQELSEIADLTNNMGDPEYCNKYSAFAWDTTKAVYNSRSGFTRPQDAYRFDVTYEAKVIPISGVDTLVGMADIVFQRPVDPTKPANELFDGKLYCADNVPVQPNEIDIIFPGTIQNADADGLLYDILRTTSAIADASTAEITYEDPVDGGSVWRLFLDRASALTNTGGPILDATQAAAIRNVMEQVLINRATTSRLATPCPPTL